MTRPAQLCNVVLDRGSDAPGYTVETVTQPGVGTFVRVAWPDWSAVFAWIASQNAAIEIVTYDDLFVLREIDPYENWRSDDL